MPNNRRLKAAPANNSTYLKCNLERNTENRGFENKNRQKKDTHPLNDLLNSTESSTPFRCS